MALQVWLPLNGNLDNQGVANATITASGAIANANGKIGNCYSIDGGYLSFINPLPNPCTKFSIAGWVNLISGYTANNGLHIISFQGTYCRICISKDGYAVRVLLTDGTTNYMGMSADVASTVQAGMWNHYAVTFDNGNVSVYINGVLNKQAQATITSVRFPSTECRIGTYGSETSKGMVNDFRIYDEALSARQVKELARGLVTHYPLSSQQVIDNVLDLSKYTGNYISAYSNTVTINGDEITINVGSDRTSGVNSQSFNALSTSTFTVDKNNVRFKAFVTDDQDNIFRGIRWTNTTTYDIAIDLAGMVANKSYVVKLKAMLYEGNITPTKYVQNLGVSRFNNNIEYDVSGFQNNGTKVGTLTYAQDSPLYKSSILFPNNCNTYIWTAGSQRQVFT